jgi:tRNA (mo5U34)-methyltransferase
MSLPTFDRFFELTQHELLRNDHDFLKARVQERLALRPHGRSDDWDDILNALPQTDDVRAELARPSVRLSSHNKVDRLVLEQQLQALKPWRKGPFNLFGLDLDTEWRSDWKWARLQKKFNPLPARPF